MIVRSICLPAVLAALCTSGCTRTGDGTMVPMFTPQLVTTGLVPHLALRETAPRRAPIAVYPPAPRVTLVSAEEAPARPAPRARRQRARTAPSPAAATGVPAAAPLSCKDQGIVGGRVRFICE